MGSAGRTPPTARQTRGSRSNGGARGDSAHIAKPDVVPLARVAPLYKRLPHGPHRLERNEVVLNQRTRIHGAMVEAVARYGYEGASVRQIIGLAGVSRRSFYEQFANKQACFLATFDLIAAREVKQIRRAYLLARGSLEDRMRIAFQRLARSTEDDRNATVLVVLEAQKAGPDGVLRLRKASNACEHMLARSLGEAPRATALPVPILRGIAGGLHAITSTFLRESRSDDLAEEMLRWTMLFPTPAAEHMAARMAAGLSARMREISCAYGHRLRGAEPVGRDERTRLLNGILRLLTREDLRLLSTPQIAEEANVPIDAFCALFTDKDDCLLAALDMIGDELRAIAADPELVSGDWPRAVPRALAELMRHLAEHPLQTRTLVQEAFFAGAGALQRSLEVSHSIATLLTAGAAADPRCALAVEAIAGAVWHTVRCQVAGGRIELLPVLSDHLAYVVLAPFIGAEAAVEIVTDERRAGSATRGACETSAPQST